MTDCPVYRAERVAWANVACFREPVADPQAFLDHVTHHALFQELREKACLPRFYVTCTYGPPQNTHISTANPIEQHINLRHGHLPSNGLLLHELAHLCTPEGAYHDHRYVANYLQLVRVWLGELAASELLRCLRLERAFP